MKATPRNKLLTALFLILSCAFIGGSGLNYHITKSAVHSEIVQNDLPLTMNNIYSDLSSELVRPTLVASSMAADTFLKDWVMDGEQDTSHVQKYLLEIKEKYGFFSSFFISSLTSNYYHFEGTHKSISYSDDHDVWYFKFIASEKEYELDVDNNEASDNILTVFINYRVLDNRDRLLGVTGVGLQVESIANLISSYQEKFNRTIYLTDASGVIQIHEDISLVDKTNIQDVEGLEKYADLILSERTGLKNYTYVKNNEKIVLNVRYIEELDWYLYVEQSETATLRTARMNFLRSIGIGVCASAVILMLTLGTLNYYQGRLEQLVETDGMTRLANRRKLEKVFETYVYLYSRAKNTFCIILMDLDGFKDVNDMLGHVEGDKVLIRIADTMSNTVRPTDTLARWGGDEFVLLAEADLQVAQEIAERIRKEVESINWPTEKRLSNDPRHKVRISCGLAEYRDQESLDSLLKRADNALYKIKRRGGNSVHVA